MAIHVSVSSSKNQGYSAWLGEPWKNVFFFNKEKKHRSKLRGMKSLLLTPIISSAICSQRSFQTTLQAYPCPRVIWKNKITIMVSRKGTMVYENPSSVQEAEQCGIVCGEGGDGEPRGSCPIITHKSSLKGKSKAWASGYFTATLGKFQSDKALLKESGFPVHLPRGAVWIQLAECSNQGRLLEGAVHFPQGKGITQNMR